MRRSRRSGGGSCATCSGKAATRSGCSRRSSATTARTSSSASASSSTSTASSSTCAPVRIGSFSLFGPAVQIYTPMHPFSARAAPPAGVRQADRDRLGRLGRRRSDHPSGSADRLRRRHRRRQRRHTGRSGSDVRGRQPMPRHTRNHGRLNRSPSTIFLLPSYLSVRTRRS